MTRRTLTIAVFLAVVLPIYGQEKGSQPAGSQGYATSLEKPRLPARTATCKVKEDGASIECNWAEGEPESYLKRLFGPENAPNIGLVVIGLGGIFAAICTLKAIEKQAEIAANSQRSWIVAKRVEKPDLSGTWILRVSCEFEVFGLSPVRVHESKFCFHFVAAKPHDLMEEAVPDLPDIPNYGEPTTLIDSPEMGVTWPPGSKILVKPTLDNSIAEEAQLRSLKAGESVLCLYGFIRYRDAFDKAKIRETRFCFTCGKQSVLNRKYSEEFVLGGPSSYNETS
jgi:hypothetical protein